MRQRFLTTVLRWLAVVLVLHVLVVILSQYTDYFPPNFESLFLQGREATFPGLYAVAFYVHLIAGPWVLMSALILVNDSLRQRYPKRHRGLGWLQVMILLGFMLPSSMVMACFAYAGWRAGLSFMLLSVTTAACALLGVIYAKRKQFKDHRRWMIRCFILINSAVVLRLISGAAEWIGVSDAETAYIIAAWCSWLVPLAAWECARSLFLPK